MKNTTKEVSKLRGVELDNLIYEYQQLTDLTKEEAHVLTLADTAYLQDNEEKAAQLMSMLVSNYEGTTITLYGGSIGE